MTIHRMAMEKEVVEAVIDALLAAGYEIQVDDGFDVESRASTNKDDVIGALFSKNERGYWTCNFDEADLLAQKAQPPHHTSFVRLVFGNNGWDVISNYGMALDEILKPAMEVCDRLEYENT